MFNDTEGSKGGSSTTDTSSTESSHTVAEPARTPVDNSTVAPGTPKPQPGGPDAPTPPGQTSPK